MSTNTPATGHPELPRLYYGTKEVAEMFGLSESLIRRWCSNGRLRSRNTGRRYMIPRDVIEEFVAGTDEPIAHPDNQGRRSA